MYIYIVNYNIYHDSGFTAWLWYNFFAVYTFAIHSRELKKNPHVHENPEVSREHK